MATQAAGQLLASLRAPWVPTGRDDPQTRTSFLLNRAGQSLEVALDRAEGLGDFAEIEALAASEPDLPPHSPPCSHWPPSSA